MYLLLPSLEEKRFINISLVSQAEAIRFTQKFTDDVKASRKLKAADDSGVDDDIIFYSNFFDLSVLADHVNHLKNGLSSETDISMTLTLLEAMHSLAVSEVRGVRGARAIFINPETNTVGVGTTVVYNKNWATLNFEDDNILQLIHDTFLNFGLIDTSSNVKTLVEDDDDEDADENSSWFS